MILFFSLFLLAMNLLIPLTMLGFGLYFRRHCPPRNHLFGYRTGLSMKNDDTWRFAQDCMGRLWSKWGAILLLLSLLLSLPLFRLEEDAAGWLSLALVLGQTGAILLSILPVEKALRATFDKDGRRK